MSATQPALCTICKCCCSTSIGTLLVSFVTSSNLQVLWSFTDLQKPICLTAGECCKCTLLESIATQLGSVVALHFLHMLLLCATWKCCGPSIFTSAKFLHCWGVLCCQILSYALSLTFPSYLFSILVYSSFGLAPKCYIISIISYSSYLFSNFLTLHYVLPDMTPFFSLSIHHEISLCN